MLKTKLEFWRGYNAIPLGHSNPSHLLGSSSKVSCVIAKISAQVTKLFTWQPICFLVL